MSRGQATVELAMVLPVLVLVCLSIVQVAAVARRDVLVTHAAREAARAAAVEPDLGAARAAAAEAAQHSAPFDPGRLVVTVSRTVADVHVEVRYVDPTNVPIVGPMVGEVTLRATVTMRREDSDAPR